MKRSTSQSNWSHENRIESLPWIWMNVGILSGMFIVKCKTVTINDEWSVH